MNKKAKPITRPTIMAPAMAWADCNLIISHNLLNKSGHGGRQWPEPLQHGQAQHAGSGKQ